MSALKRAACDRCHGQKMRCIREPAQSSCNRCLAASSPCVFSTARKAGRPPTSLATKRNNARRFTSSRQEKQQQPSPVSPMGYEDVRNSSMESTVCTTSNFNSIFCNTVDDETSLSLFDTVPATSESDLWSDLFKMCDTDLEPPWAENDHRFDVADQPDFRESAPMMDDDFSSSVIRATEPSLPTASSTMQQLSELSGKLIDQIQSFSSANPTVIDFQMPRLEQLAAHVIESSVCFHRILSDSQSLLKSSDTRDCLSSDTAAILQILTTYIRLTQLHHTLYRNMKLVLKPSDLSPPSNLPVPFPALHIGGVSLSSYPRFQLKFILQICVHHLGEVEALLGLPSDFCVSEHIIEKGGILHQGTRGMNLLVRTIMKEVEKTVKGIRTILAELIEATRGQIQV